MRERVLLAGLLACGLALAACSKDKANSREEAPAAVSVSVVVPPTPIPTFSAPPDVASPPADATKTPSGLAFKVLKPGTGKDHPGPADGVKVYYVGWTKAGREFDSIEPPLVPMSFRVTRVMAGWKEALQLMVAGEKRRLWIPAGLANGEDAHAGVPGGDLVFDLELVGILTGPKPPRLMP
jgi:FKBP-type peptidyl-prolyl cis-trans isomerase